MTGGGNTLKQNAVRWLAKALIGLWGCWWTYFALAVCITEGGWNNALAAVIATTLFLGSAGLAWRWERPGSLLLITLGLAVCGAYVMGIAQGRPIAGALFVLSVLGLPPLVAGLLLLGRRGERPRATDTG